MNKKSAFTLIELLISVSIIAILIAIGIASYSTLNKQSRDTKRKSDIEQIRSALEMYRAENGHYPSGGCVGATCAFADALVLASELVSTYIPAIPLDPKTGTTEAYEYEYKATGLSSGEYYGYCLSATLETQDFSDTCTPDTSNGQNYGVKNP